MRGPILARYKAGRPMPLPQSLAKIIRRESSSHAGSKMLQSPPVSRSAVPGPVSGRTQICLVENSDDINAAHRLSGEMTKLLDSPGSEPLFISMAIAGGLNKTGAVVLCATS